MIPSIDILILAAVSIFIIYKLYSTLGFSNDEDQNVVKNTIIENSLKIVSGADTKTNEETSLNKIPLPNNVRAVFDQFYKYLPNFNEEIFLKNAEKAFEVIIEAYSNQDLNLLKTLLVDNVFDEFKNDITIRKDKNEILNKTLLSVVSTEIIFAELVGSEAFVRIKFTSQQINLIKDLRGNIIEGSPSQIDHAVDIWSFAKDLTIKDPVWRLSDTEAL